MKTKICTVCGEEKPATLEYFHAYNRSSDGVRSVCKVCRSKDNADHRAERTAKKREHYAKHRERLLAITHANYQKNKEKRRAYAREQHQKNRERNIRRMRIYLEKNREVLNERRRPLANDRFKRLYGNDLSFTLTHRTRALVCRSLRSNKRSRKLEDALGYTVDDLRRHIENLFSDGMNWDKFLKGEIHIDHIIPISFFNPKSANDPAFKKCWDLSNLQPLWAYENLSKGSKIL